MTHDIQLMLVFLPGGLILLRFFLLLWHVKMPELVLIKLVFDKYSFSQDSFPNSFSISLFPALWLPHITVAALTSWYLYWIGFRRLPFKPIGASV